MKILVCISHVPDTTSKINFTDDNSKFDTNGVQYVINPYDEFALTRAMWFKEKQGASVTTVTVGLADVEPTLRKTLAIGADDAIRIDASPTDGFFVAKQIAKIAKENNYDLILAGRESIDYNGAMVPGMLATLLDYNFVNACIGIEIENTTITAIKEIDGGNETLKTTTPAVIAGQKGMVEEKDLKIPNMRGIMMARKKPLTVVTALETNATSKTINYEKPAEKSACKMIDANDIDGLIDLLHNEAKVI
ncbi:MAG: electron transfer flavoprotein subunit beta/FixA family protein [Flavicella sp.]